MDTISQFIITKYTSTRISQLLKVFVDNLYSSSSLTTNLVSLLNKRSRTKIKQHKPNAYDLVPNTKLIINGADELERNKEKLQKPFT